MKVHRIITTIEVENDNSITSVELTKLYPTDADIPLAITNMTTNGNADDITKVYDSVNKSRLGISGKLKSIAHIINDSLDAMIIMWLLMIILLMKLMMIYSYNILLY